MNKSTHQKQAARRLDKASAQNESQLVRPEHHGDQGRREGRRKRKWLANQQRDWKGIRSTPNLQSNEAGGNRSLGQQLEASQNATERNSKIQTLPYKPCLTFTVTQHLSLYYLT